MVRSFAAALVERYGLAEVAQWRFEVQAMTPPTPYTMKHTLHLTHTAGVQ
jgi:hypothetical protein